MSYNTMNPLGSKDPRDLSDNADGLDAAVNGTARSWRDRFGRERATMQAVEDAVPDALVARDGAELAAAQASGAAAAAEAARDAAVVGAGFYATEPEGRAAVADGETFKVVGTGTVSAYLYRRVNAASSTLEAVFPASAAVDALNHLISDAAEPAVLEAVVDEEAGVHRLMTEDFHQDRVHRVEGMEKGGALLSEDGGVLLYQDEERTIVGPLEVGHTDMPGVYVVDGEGGVHAALAGDTSADESTPVRAGPLDAGAFFSGVLVGALGVEMSLHVPSMLADRERAAEVICTLASTTEPVLLSSSQMLAVKPEALGASAHLVLRNMAAPNDRQARVLSVKTVPVPAAAALTPKVLLIGDSIGNRQGAQLLAQHLNAWGYGAAFVGTLNGSAVASNANDATGPMGECREGWETGDFTYAITDRVRLVAPGDEAVYMASDKPTKWPQNPLLRAAIESDDAADVRNGCIVDLADYQARFGLAVPDVVVWAVGTNDVRDRTEAEIYDVVRANDALMYRRIRAAWPAAKIIRTLPGTAMDLTRDELWQRKYVPLLRAAFDAIRDVGGGVSVAPCWAMANHEAGYNWVQAPDATTGFTPAAVWSDAIHPVGAARAQLYRSLSPYVAAAALNLI